jgi:hypothetical protein
MARVLEIAIQQLSGELSDPGATIRELTGRHVAGGETGNISDLEIAVAAILSENAGDAETARCILSNYLKNYRRGPAPIAGILRDTIVRIGASELPPWCRIYEIKP